MFNEKLDKAQELLEQGFEYLRQLDAEELRQIPTSLLGDKTVAAPEFLDEAKDVAGKVGKGLLIGTVAIAATAAIGVAFLVRKVTK